MNLSSMMRAANIFGQKPEQSTADAGGFNPLKRFQTGIGPEPKTPWQSTFQVPKFHLAGSEAQSTQSSAERDSMDDGDFMRQVMEMSKPGPSMQAYQTGLGEQPQMQDYRPSKWRTLAATVGGAAAGLRDTGQGVAVAENISQGPYNRARQAWSDKMAGLGEGAKVEADIQGNQSKSYMDALTHRQALNKFRYDQSKDAQAQSNKDREFGLDVFKANQADYDIQQTPNGPLLVDKKGFHQPIQINATTLPMIHSLIEDRQAATGEQNARTGIFNAETSRGQLGVAQGNLGLNTQKFGWDQEVDKDKSQMGWSNLFQPQPEKEKAGRDLALEELYAEPGMAQYIDKRRLSSGGFTYSPRYFGTNPNASQKQFMNILRDRTMQKSGRSAASPQLGQADVTPEGYVRK